uniref:Uncharacterized protein n=1 Tax=Anguilla anguilla TaxID=7936 RepID=A0A0E9WWG2_ANGAN
MTSYRFNIPARDANWLEAGSGGLWMSLWPPNSKSGNPKSNAVVFIHTVFRALKMHTLLVYFCS